MGKVLEAYRGFQGKTLPDTPWGRSTLGYAGHDPRNFESPFFIEAKRSSYDIQSQDRGAALSSVIHLTAATRRSRQPKKRPYFMMAIPLAVVAALKDELRDLESRLQGQFLTKNPEDLDAGGGRLTLGAWGRGLPLLLVRTGMGAAAMARNLRRALEQYGPGFCLLVGYGGGVLPELRPGDLVIATSLIEAPRHLVFPVAPELVARAERICNRQSGFHCRAGPLLTVAEIAMTPRDKTAAAQNYAGALAVDLESAAFAQVCQGAGLPFLVVRAILDPLDFSLPNPLAWTPALRELADRARASLTAFTTAWLGNWARTLIYLK